MALQGLLLFLFIPFVLFLFLGQPWGPGWSVGLGLAIMAGHRFVAAPWMAKFADVRCLWCGRIGVSTIIAVHAGGRTWRMGACSEEHAGRVAAFLRFVHRFRAPIGAGILAPLAWLLAASLAAAVGRPWLTHGANALVFRVVVAATVVSAATIPFLFADAFGTTPDRPTLRCPFPLHNLFLLGIRNTLWIVRIVGTWWLVDGLWRLVRA